MIKVKGKGLVLI